MNGRSWRLLAEKRLIRGYGHVDGRLRMIEKKPVRYKTTEPKSAPGFAFHSSPAWPGATKKG